MVINLKYKITNLKAVMAFYMIAIGKTDTLSLYTTSFKLNFSNNVIEQYFMRLKLSRLTFIFRS